MLAQSSQARSNLQTSSRGTQHRRAPVGGIGTWIDSIAACPWPALTGARSARRGVAKSHALYTPAQRARRDASIWTTVQAVLAPIQFLVFLVSLSLVVRYLQTGGGYEIAAASVVAKTMVLYLIMVTGSIWEKVVFDKWLFAHAFFWEDVFSMLVLALHTLYLGALMFDWWSPQTQMMIAVAAYGAYVINAGQFLWKLRAARLEGASDRQAPAGGHAA